MARRSQCSSAGDNPLDPNYLPPHYREEYRLAIDALVEEDLEGYYQFLQKADVVDFLSSAEIQYIQETVQLPQQSAHPEQRFLEPGGDGSSDTYWPIHSDLDAPGLDLGWPQLHHFIGPTEVTTLVNPPEPDMPSIKEQARRLIKNAQQVIAIVMDMFTDVDILHDILNAAMRNVAVYILLDKQNVHHFVNMVSNCRVNIQSIQFLRVRTVSGITYHCRSGKSFQGQMMDRFLLTDCRAVLSGNYSFMWSFEKIHRCMAHLFLGQLVSTFDEEFRILFAQSEPLMIENMLPPMDDFSLLHKRQYPSERTPLYRDQWKFRSLDTAHPDEWARHSYDDRMDTDWRMAPLKRKEHVHGPADIYNRFPQQQSRMDPSFDQGPSRMPMLENAAFKRHSFAEGVHGRYSFPFLPQQGVADPENQGRQFHRGQQPYPGPGPGPGPGKEADYSAYDKFWSQGYDQYSEPDLPQEMEPPDNFDPVFNYLSSTRNVDFDQGSEKLPPAADLPFSSSHHRRLSLGQPFACQTSPTPSNPSEQKQLFQEPLSSDRKDPKVKRGLRDWRISSYLSAYDNPGDEDLPLAPPNVSDPFEDPSNLTQQTTPGIDLSVPKIPNVREFKVPAIPRASQMPSYAKTTAREQPKKLPDEPTAVPAETKTTPTPSESSSTTEGEKTEEVEPKEPKTAVLRRDESFRRKYNVAVQRSSRLRSSLLFSSLDQPNASQDTNTAQQDEEGDKNEGEQTKQPYVSQVLGQRRSREPFEWSRYVKSATVDVTDSSKPDDGNSKADDKDSSKDENSKDSEKCEAQESSKTPEVEQASSSMPRPKPPEAELPKTAQPIQAPKSLLTGPYVDMNDPDMRFMFFKELAAKRKAAKAAEMEKSKEKAPMKPPTELKTEEPAEKMADSTTSEGLSSATAEDAGKTISKDACKSVSLSSDASDKTNKEGSQVKNDPNTTQSCSEEKNRVPTDSEKLEPKNSQPEAPQSEPPEEPKLSSPAVEKSSPGHPPTPTNATPVDVPALAQGTDQSENPCLDSTSKKSTSLTPSPVEVPPSSPLDSNTKNHILTDSGLLISPSHSPSSLTPLATPAETISSHVTPKDSSSIRTSSISSPNAQETVSFITQAVEETSQKSTASSSTQPHFDSVSQSTSSKTLSAVDSDTCAAGSEPNTSSVQSTAKRESCASTPSEEDVLGSENNSVPQDVGEESEVPGSSKDAKADSLSPSTPESCLPNVADLESKSRFDKNETIIPAPSSADPPPEHSPKETSSPVHQTPNASQSVTTASPQDAPIKVTRPCKLDLTGPVTRSPAESVGSDEAPLHSPSDTNSPLEQVTTHSNKTPVLPSTETCSPSEPTSKVPKELDLPCKTPESVTSENSQNEESQEPEIPDPGEKKTDDTEATNKVNKTQESTCSEKTNDQERQSNGSELPEVTSDDVVPLSPQSKQPKSNQSRYQSSTANVLSSSNLRDDTKLLLEQISANSQSRNEGTKEPPVTDDEKEDEADKNAKREKERGIRSLSREQPKSNQEREKLLERIQSMRKERKVYSRFEMAP